MGNFFIRGSFNYSYIIKVWMSGIALKSELTIVQIASVRLGI